MRLRTDYTERARRRQRLGQLVVLAGLLLGAGWSFLTVPSGERGRVAVLAVGASAAVLALALAVAWADGKLAQRHSLERRQAWAVLAVPVGVAVAALARAAVPLDEMFDGAGGRTLILSAVLTLFTSLTWLYRFNNGLARERPPDRSREDGLSGPGS